MATISAEFFIHNAPRRTILSSPNIEVLDRVDESDYLKRAWFAIQSFFSRFYCCGSQVSYLKLRVTQDNGQNTRPPGTQHIYCLAGTASIDSFVRNTLNINQDSRCTVSEDFCIFGREININLVGKDSILIEKTIVDQESRPPKRRRNGAETWEQWSAANPGGTRQDWETQRPGETGEDWMKRIDPPIN